MGRSGLAMPRCRGPNEPLRLSRCHFRGRAQRGRLGIGESSILSLSATLRSAKARFQHPPIAEPQSSTANRPIEANCRSIDTGNDVVGKDHLQTEGSVGETKGRTTWRDQSLRRRILQPTRQVPRRPRRQARCRGYADAAETAGSRGNRGGGTARRKLKQWRQSRRGRKDSRGTNLDGGLGQRSHL
jgi:hypothetical protein